MKEIHLVDPPPKEIPQQPALIYSFHREPLVLAYTEFFVRQDKSGRDILENGREVEFFTITDISLRDTWFRCHVVFNHSLHQPLHYHPHHNHLLQTHQNHLKLLQLLQHKLLMTSSVSSLKMPD